jgi:hypothetical protein
MHKEVSDLPLPDSPMRPTISFFFILNEIDFINFLFSGFSVMLTHSFFISSNILFFDFKDYYIEVAILYPSAIYLNKSLDPSPFPLLL